MTAVTLAELRAVGITVERNGDRLKLKAPRGTLSEGLRAWVATSKSALLAELANGEPVAGSPDALAPADIEARFPEQATDRTVSFVSVPPPTPAENRAPVGDPRIRPEPVEADLRRRIRAMAARWNYSDEELRYALERAALDPAAWRDLVDDDERWRAARAGEPRERLGSAERRDAAASPPQVER
jgi:hypothetical protein